MSVKYIHKGPPSRLHRHAEQRKILMQTMTIMMTHQKENPRTIERNAWKSYPHLLLTPLLRSVEVRAVRWNHLQLSPREIKCHREALLPVHLATQLTPKACLHPLPVPCWLPSSNEVCFDLCFFVMYDICFCTTFVGY